ncbi:MAG: GntR family transcriptional regulator [Devosia sp.]
MYDPSSPFRRKLPRHRQKKAFAEQRLREAILWCELNPGETVTEVDLVDRFGIGRAAVRVALARLASLGLVQPIPRAGWRVQPMSGALIGQVIAARRLVEPALCEVLVTQEVRARCNQLVAVIEAMGGRETPEALLSSRTYSREVGDILLAHINPLLASFLGDLWDQSDRIIRFFERRNGPRFNTPELRTLLDAIFAQDIPAVRGFCAREIDRLESFVAARLLHDDSELTLPAGSDKPRPVVTAQIIEDGQKTVSPESGTEEGTWKT